MRKTLLLLLLSAVQMVPAQTNCFTYADDGKTITGVSTTGISTVENDGELTIPATVVTVKVGAFADIKANGKTLSALIIEEGGNPAFELADGKNALADVNGSLSSLSLGSGMSVENITTLLEGLGGKGNLSKIDIYNANFPLDASITSETINANTAGVKVVLPAARVSNATTIGSGSIYGRFTLTSELVTFCGSALFEDTDAGSQFLFYVPTEVKTFGEEKRLYIQRVRYILPNEGVLLHKTDESSTTVVLPRVAEPESNTQYDTDEALFGNNMLVGVTVATTIDKTEEKADGTYTNLILSKGFFYPTSGGTLGANRAYLQVKSTDVAGLARMTLFSDDETDGISQIVLPPGESHSPVWQGASWHSINGQRLNGDPQRHGVYIHQGRKVMR